MNANQNQLCRASGSTRSASLTRATGHPYTPLHQIHAVNPLHTLKDPSKARNRPYLYSSHSFSIHVPLPSPNLSSSTPSRPFPAQPSSIALPRDNTRAVPSKRALDYTPGPSTLYRAPQIHPSSDRPAKRPRLDMGPPRTAPNHGGSQPPMFVKPVPPIQPSSLGANPSRRMPRHKKAPLSSLTVDYGCPIQVPPPPYPGISDSERLEELKGPVDPATAGELGDLMWMQQRRIWDDREGYSDPFVGRRIPISLLDDRPSSSGQGGIPTQSQPEMIALYGPPPRNNESTHLGERLTNLNATAVGNNEDAGFEEVLDLYRGAVQGSTLSMELELAVGGDAGLGVSWEAAGSLEVSIRHGSRKPRESRVCTLAEYRRIVEAKKVVSRPAIPREEPPSVHIDIEWSYQSCGYATGRIVNSQKACKQSRQQSAPSTSADPPHRH